MSRPKEWRILAGLVFGVVVLIFVAALLLGSVTEQRKTAEWASHTRDVLDKINEVVNYLSDAENGRRGYVLSGQDRYFGHYTNRVGHVEAALSELRGLMKDDPRQSAVCDQLEAMIRERLTISTNSIRARQETGLEVSAQTAFMEQGQLAMEPIRKLAAQMTAEQRKLLVERQAVRDKNVDGTLGFAVLVSLLGLCLFIVLFFLFARANRRRQHAEEVLHRSNLELEQRVKDRTADLSRTIEKLEQADEFRTRVMESAVFGLGVLDLDGRFALANAQFGETTGYTPEELLGKPYSILLSPENDASLRPQFLRIVREKQPLSHREIELIRKDGSVISVVLSWSPLLAQGEVRGVVGTALDITERKRAEVKLRDQLNRLDLLHRITRAIGERQDLRSIFQVVIRRLEDSLPIDFCCICLYDAAAESLTVTSVGVKSAPLAMELAMAEKAHVPIDQNGLSRCVHGQLVYEPDIGPAVLPFPKRLADGGLRSLVAAPLLVESQVFGVLVAARRQAHGFSSPDCEFLRQLSEHVALASHQAQIYSALQQAFNELRQTQQNILQQERLRAVGQMASGIAHDINNAVSPVALYAESLLEQEPNLSARAREYLGTIQRAVEDVAQTVARMRDFYRQREPQLSLSPVRLNELVQQVLDFTRARWSDMPQERGIVIHVKTDLATDLPSIMGAEGEIRDALTNLVLNAVDAMPEGGTLTLQTRPVRDSSRSGDSETVTGARVEIGDTGVGMDEETKRRCLEPFFTTKGERGTGLGLATVYGMVQRHSAEIEIDSRPGKGTTMRVIFPVTSSTVTPAERPSAAPVKPLHRLRLLVVDDDPLLIKSLRDALEGDGHLITVADGGQSGIDAFAASVSRGEPFTAVITDLGMPSVDGRRVAEAVKAASLATPVILLTGWGQRLVAENDIPPHVDRVLNKPPRLRELREALAHCCPGAGADQKPKT